MEAENRVPGRRETPPNPAPKAGAERCGIETEGRDSDEHHERGQHAGPDHKTSRRIPFERGRSSGAAVSRTRQQPEIANVSGVNGGAGEDCEFHLGLSYGFGAKGLTQPPLWAGAFGGKACAR